MPPRAPVLFKTPPFEDQVVGNPHHDTALGDLPGGQVQRGKNGNCRIEVNQSRSNKSESGLSRQPEQAHKRRTSTAQTVDQAGTLR